jgi:hypothetical protein
VIATSFRRGPFRLMVYRYCNRPDWRKAFGLTAYLHTRSGGRVLGYVRRPSLTKVIDLDRDERELLQGCTENTAYEIRRAERDGVEFGLEPDRDRFLAMYNAFAAAKGIATASRADLDPYGDSFVITKASIGGETVAVHSYLCDRAGGRVRLAHSASIFRESEDPKRRQLIGRAGRFLHFRDMLHFKRLGYLIYDLGGYGINSPRRDLQQIARFKDSFGGGVLAETDYFSIPHFAYRLCKNALARWRRPTVPSGTADRS